jgi:predicted Zn-dependent peptidase
MEDKTKLTIDYDKFYLPNGLKCVLYQRSEIHSVNIQITVNVGSLDENDKSNGISHFIEHVVHEGTKDFPTWEAVEDFRTEHSATTNAYTTLDHTQYYGTFPYQYLDQGLYLFSQIVLHPLFSDSEVEKERDIIIDEIKGGEDEIDFKIIRNILENRFINDQTPFSYDVAGTTQRVKDISKQDLIEFWEKHYVPENIEIYIVGNFDLEETKRLLLRYFHDGISDKKYGAKPERKFKDEFPEYSNERLTAKQKLDLDKYYLTFNFPAYEFKFTQCEERYKLSFLKDVTASSSYFQSVLWKKLRQELGIVYGVSCWTYGMFSRNFLGIETSFEKEHLETILQEFYNGIESIKKGSIDDNVFKFRKKKTLDTQLMQLDKPDQALNWISMYEDELEIHGRGLMLGDYLEYVEKLTFDNIINVANEVFDWDKLNIGIVSKDDAKEVELTLKTLWDKIRNNKK